MKHISNFAISSSIGTEEKIIKIIHESLRSKNTKIGPSLFRAHHRDDGGLY